MRHHRHAIHVPRVHTVILMARLNVILVLLVQILSELEHKTFLCVSVSNLNEPFCKEIDVPTDPKGISQARSLSVLCNQGPLTNALRHRLVEKLGYLLRCCMVNLSYNYYLRNQI